MATKRDKARTLLSLVGFEEGLKEETASLIASGITDVSVAEEEAREAAAFRQRYESAIARYREVAENIHLELFSEEELDQLIVFHESPTGRRFIELLPEIGERLADAHEAAIEAAFEEGSAQEDNDG